MPFPPPTPEQLREAARAIELKASDSELGTYHGFLAGIFAEFDKLEAAEEVTSPVRYPRSEARQPTAAENPYGAWAQRVVVNGAKDGLLAGRSVALKDNICLAGVPMGGGTGFLADYVPPVDATIVERILDAGGTIVGKSACEYLSLSAGSHTSTTGPVHNPHRRGYTTGGSSSGSGALVASGDVDLAIGGDQGGSIRIPASLCGIVGLKPTYGLVPYTGIMSIEASIDHTGPMTRTVADNALLLEVLAGPDGEDPRQAGCKTARYIEALAQGPEGLRIGVLEEGFTLPNSDPNVLSCVESAANHFAELGSTVERISVPAHTESGPLLFPPIMLGVWEAIRGDGVVTNVANTLPPGLPEAFAGWRSEGSRAFPEYLKLFLLAAHHIDKRGGRPLYAKAARLRRVLRGAYNQALTECDLLLMPTTPLTAQPIPERNAPIEERVQREGEMAGNTGPFNVTGHPAISIPCGQVDGLPVGVMLVGRHWEETTIYRAAQAYEQSAG